MLSETQNYTFYQEFYCNSCQHAFSVPVEKSEEEIPTSYRSRYLTLLKQEKKLIWPFDETLTEEEVRQMERETVRCPNAQDKPHIVQFIWQTGGGND